MSFDFLHWNPADILSESDLLHALSLATEEYECVNHAVASKYDGGVFIWGTREVARRVAAILDEYNIPLLGVFDSDPEVHGLRFAGHTVESPKEVGAPIILCSYWLPRQLEDARRVGFGENCLAAWQLLLELPRGEHLPWNCLRPPSDFSQEDQFSLSQLLARTEDGPELLRQVAARHFVGILSENQKPSHSPEKEYFVPEFWSPCKGGTLFDAGAYSGDTIRRYLNCFHESEWPQLGMVAFEPDSANFAELSEFLNNLPSWSVAMKAVVGSESGISGFFESVDSKGSLMRPDANAFVPVVTIDEVAAYRHPQQVKMDIEGAECEALEGSTSTIHAADTYWTIASYHRFGDLWDIPSYFPNSYRIRVSSHAPRPWDTTLHFIPMEGRV